MLISVMDSQPSLVVKCDGRYPVEHARYLSESSKIPLVEVISDMREQLCEYREREEAFVGGRIGEGRLGGVRRREQSIAY
jgi:hypothetical protein